MARYQKLENSAIDLYSHEVEQCQQLHCPLHHRSNHCMRQYEQFYIKSNIERICTHGVHHPDPDDPRLYTKDGYWNWVHPCDGCCIGCYPEEVTTLPEDTFDSFYEFLESSD